MRPLLVLVGVLSCVALGGCSSTINEADLAAADRMAETRTGSPTDTGTFPNLNIPPAPTEPQITAEEKAEKLAALKAAQKGQKPGTTGESPEARIKRLKLLADKQNNTLKVIENN